MVKKIKTFEVGDLVRVFKITADRTNIAGYVPEMDDYVGKSFRVLEACSAFSKLPYIGEAVDGNGWFFDNNDLKRIRKASQDVKKEAPPVVKKAVTVSVASDEGITEEDVKELAQLEVDVAHHGAAGLCSFAITYSDGKDRYKYIHAPCHAQLYREGAAKRVYLSALKHHDGNYISFDKKKAYKQYVYYILNESPWKHVFVTKSVAYAFSSGVVLQTGVPHTQVLGACIALREGHENYHKLIMFSDLLKHDFSSHTAYLVSCAIKGTLEAPVITGISNGHRVLAPDMCAKGLFKFFREGYDGLLLPEGRRKPYSNPTARSHEVAAYIAKREGATPTITAFMDKILETKVKVYPWEREAKVDVNKEKVLKLCSAIESKIIGEKE